ncbi:hypothetical protein [Flectobacillus major]|uniref:hypothetical protein n=1 Tax=Flectobacillus major TaxID=103 RepID=UPI00047AD9F6|nr:hypothetical protein [Flectobacillus major]
MKKKLHLTAVWQNGGFSAKLNIWNSIEHCANFVHLCFDFRHFAKLQTVGGYRKNHALRTFTQYIFSF